MAPKITNEEIYSNLTNKLSKICKKMDKLQEQSDLVDDEIAEYKCNRKIAICIKFLIIIFEIAASFYIVKHLLEGALNIYDTDFVFILISFLGITLLLEMIIAMLGDTIKTREDDLEDIESEYEESFEIYQGLYEEYIELKKILSDENEDRLHSGVSNSNP